MTDETCKPAWCVTVKINSVVSIFSSCTNSSIINVHMSNINELSQLPSHVIYLMIWIHILTTEERDGRCRRECVEWCDMTQVPLCHHIPPLLSTPPDNCCPHIFCGCYTDCYTPHFIGELIHQMEYLMLSYVCIGLCVTLLGWQGRNDEFILLVLESLF